MSMPKALLAIALVMLMWTVVACGDDDDDGTATPGDNTETIVLIFPKTSATGFDFVEAERQVAASEAKPLAIVRALVAGPTETEMSGLGVIDPFPSGVEVLSLDVTGSTATVDFSSELLDYGGGSANVEAISGSITRTIERATGASDVVILVAGEADQLQP